MRECTFKPQRVATVQLKVSVNKAAVDSENPAVHTASPASGGVKRYEELYANSKHNLQQRRIKVDKTKEDYELERNKEEFTFQPHLVSKGHVSVE